MLIALRTLERVALKQYNKAKDNAPKNYNVKSFLLVPEAVRNNFNITKRLIIIWSWMMKGSITRALFIAKPKIKPTIRLTI